jgi:hypothetical protein
MLVPLPHWRAQGIGILGINTVHVAVILSGGENIAIPLPLSAPINGRRTHMREEPTAVLNELCLFPRL